MAFLLRNKFALLAGLALLATAALFAHWFWRSAQAESGLHAVAEALRASGWRVEIGEVSAGGSPNRIDLAVSAPSLASSDERWRASSERLETRALAYRDDIYWLDAPAPIALETPLGAWTLAAPEAIASLSFEADDLARLSLDAPALQARAADGGETPFSRFQLHLRSETDIAGYRLYAALEDGPGGIDAVFDGTAGFVARLGRAPISAGLPDRLVLQPGLTLAWPDASLVLRGELAREGGAWLGLLGFESDQAALVIDRLEALGLIPAPAAAKIRARISAAGRLAGVLAIEPGGATVRDVSPDDIPLWPAR